MCGPNCHNSIFNTADTIKPIFSFSMGDILGDYRTGIKEGE
jgi:hypothetical protein